MNGAFHVAIMGAMLLGARVAAIGQAPPPAQMWYTWGFVPEPAWLAGDSLKVVLSWKQPADTVAAGKVDSTVYVIRPSKPIAFYSGQAGAANVNTRRSFPAGVLSDSFKLARPALMDSVTFRGTGFVQCRKVGAGGGCSLPGAFAFSNVHDFTPQPTTPSIRITAF